MIFAKSATLIFTVVIFSNSYEIVLERDLPYTYSVKTFYGSEYLSQSTYQEITIDQQNKLTSNYGNPKIVKFPGINARLELVKPILSQEKYLVRTNKAHYMMDESGNIVIYMLKSFQTIEDIDGLKTGDNIFLDSDKGWRYVYRIDELTTSSLESNIILPTSENPQLLVIIEDTKSGINYTLRCEYLTVINVQR